MDLPVDHGIGRMGVAFRKRCLAAGAPWVHTARAPPGSVGMRLCEDPSYVFYIGL
jgi:hypothetical protein